MPIHKVEPGEHLASIAAEHGFSNVATIWDHAKNADLKKKRDPNVLLVGDAIFIPEKIPKLAAVSTGASHQFKVKQPKLKLRLTLLDFLGKPIVGKDVVLEVDGQIAKGTDGEGTIELDVSPSARQGKITYSEGTFEIQIGHLDPVEEESGVRGRLTNLGYLVVREGDDEEAEDEESEDEESEDEASEDEGEASEDEDATAGDGSGETADTGETDAKDEDEGEDGDETLSAEALRLAIQDFQVDNDLDVTGKLDDATRNKLREVHGC